MARVFTPVALAKTDDELRAAFAALKTRADVAALLAVSEGELMYILFRGGKKYIEFDVPKRSGGTRHISAPTGSIKILQRRLNQVLQAVYVPKAPVHGFARTRSIVSNADRHLNKQVVLNVDLEDFFPTIHFGRVEGLFASAYKLPLPAARALAQVCTHNTILPQGAPTSPIVSNMVCASLDTALRKLAQAHGCVYTRYADDLTFSTTRPKIPSQIAEVKPGPANERRVEVGPWLLQIIEGNTFKVNERKVRLRVVGQRFEVTGLVVGRGVNVPREYVRGVRGLLHAWEKYGYQATERELRARHHRKHRRPGSPAVSLLAVASGKLEFLRMVRGADDLLYTRLWNRFVALAGPPYKLKVAKAQTLDQVNSAVWLLEWEGGSGTAFALDGYGLVTCAHCAMADRIIAHQPGPQIVKQYEVTVTHRDDDLDLARLSLNETPMTVLHKGDDSVVKAGQATIVAGYGNYAPGSEIRLLNGHVTGKGIRSGVPVMYTDHRAFAGNSGGPVLTHDLRVVGVLQRAVTPRATGQETTVLPVHLIDKVPPV